MSDSETEVKHDLPEGYDVEEEAEGLVNLTATCAGCGEVVYDEIVFEDTLDDISGEPIHDSTSCLQKARGDA